MFLRLEFGCDLGETKVQSRIHRGGSFGLSPPSGKKTHGGWECLPGAICTCLQCEGHWGDWRGCSRETPEL